MDQTNIEAFPAQMGEGHGYNEHQAHVLGWSSVGKILKSETSKQRTIVGSYATPMNRM